MEMKNDLPMLLTANHLESMGFTRAMAYALLNRDDLPVMTIGRRKFVRKDTFFEWLTAHESTNTNTQHNKI